MSASLNEEVELRDLVMQVLESNGTLNKLKSQLRASVFLAMENNSTLKTSSSPKDDSQLKAFLKTAEGPDVFGLVRDVLSACNLTYTLNVFDSEIKHSLGENNLPSRAELQSRLRLSQELENIPLSVPLLSDVITRQRFEPQAERHSLRNEGVNDGDGERKSPSGHRKMTSEIPQLEQEIVETHQILKISKTEGRRSPHSPQKDRWSDEKDNDPLDLLPKISPNQKSRRNRNELTSIEKTFDSLDIDDEILAVEKKPAEHEHPVEAKKVEKKKPAVDANDNPDEHSASFFDERPPWEEKDYTDDFVGEGDEGSPRKNQLEDDCKVTEASDEDEDVTMDETPSSEHRPSGDLLEASATGTRAYSPTSSASDFTLNVDSSLAKSQYSHLANHPRLANVQFLEDVESTKF